MYSILMCRYNAIPVKLLAFFFFFLQKLRNSHMEIQRTKNSQGILKEKKKNAGLLPLSCTKPILKLQLRQCGIRARPVSLISGTDQHLERDSLIYSHLIDGKDDAAVPWERGSFFSKWCSVSCYLEGKVSGPVPHFIRKNGLQI